MIRLSSLTALTVVARAFGVRSTGLADFRAIEGLITIYLDPLPMHLGQRLRAMIGFVPSRTGIDFLRVEAVKERGQPLIVMIQIPDRTLS